MGTTQTEIRSHRDNCKGKSRTRGNREQTRERLRQGSNRYNGAVYRSGKRNALYKNKYQRQRNCQKNVMVCGN